MKTKKIKSITIIIIITLILIISMILFDYFKTGGLVDKENTDNIQTQGDIIELDSFTLKQKISQMMIIRGDSENLEYNNLNVGGIFLDRQDSEQDYKNIIKNFQDNSKIKLFVSTDLEGAWNPFTKFKTFPHLSEIKNKEEAYQIGLEHGKLLKKIGFNLNFAPVAEFEDLSYGGRVFVGTNDEIKEKISSYILGLQENVFGTCKHYPGKGMMKNLHTQTDKQEITKEDLELFQTCLENNISAIMVSHPIAYGEVDSNGNPATVSENIISEINGNQLIIADEINMDGLKNFYPDKISLYVDLINAGENLILDFKLSPEKLYKLLEDLEKELEMGTINKEKIDESVKKILEMKGYVVG